MGYLTTFTIYNDAYDQIDGNEMQLAEGIKMAMHGGQLMRGNDQFALGNHANAVTVQKPKHADDKTIYIHKGNCLYEVNSYDKRFKELARKDPNFVKSITQYLQFVLEDIEKMEELKEDNNE